MMSNNKGPVVVAWVCTNDKCRILDYSFIFENHLSWKDNKCPDCESATRPLIDLLEWEKQERTIDVLTHTQSVASESYEELKARYDTLRSRAGKFVKGFESMNPRTITYQTERDHNFRTLLQDSEK